MVGNTLLLGIFWVNLGKWIHEISSQKDGGNNCIRAWSTNFPSFFGGGGWGWGGGGVGVVVELKVIFNFSLKYFFQSSITK